MQRRGGSFRGESGETLHTIHWQPGGKASAAVVLMHGYAEHAGRYEGLANELAGLGFAVHALEFAGHGQSTGPRGEVPSFDGLVADLGSFIAQLRSDQPGLRFGLLGHSVGAAVATALCVREPRAVDALVLLSPYLRHGLPVPAWRSKMMRLLARRLPWLGVGGVDASHLSRIPAEVTAYRKDPLVYHRLSSARTVSELFGGFETLQRADLLTVPLLLLHGSADKVAHPEASAELARRASSSDLTFELVPGGYHELLNDLDRESVSRRIVEWLEQRLLR